MAQQLPYVKALEVTVYVDVLNVSEMERNVSREFKRMCKQYQRALEKAEGTEFDEERWKEIEKLGFKELEVTVENKKEEIDLIKDEKKFKVKKEEDNGTKKNGIASISVDEIDINTHIHKNINATIIINIPFPVLSLDAISAYELFMLSYNIYISIFLGQ